MPRRKSPFPEKPWHPDPVKWKKHLKDVDPGHDLKPDKGWQLWRWDTLADAPQGKRKRYDKTN